MTEEGLYSGVPVPSNLALILFSVIEDSLVREGRHVVVVVVVVTAELGLSLESVV